MKINTKSFIMLALFTAVLFSSCSKDEAFVAEIDSDASITIDNIKTNSVILNINGFDNDIKEGHSIVVTNKESGLEVYSNNVLIEGIQITDLESLQTYIASVEVEGYEKSPYKTIEFTTTLYDNINSINIDQYRNTKMGFDVEIDTDISVNSNLGNIMFFLVAIENESDKTQIEMTKKENILSFKVPEDLITEESSVNYRDFIIQYGENENDLESFKLSMNGTEAHKIRVFYHKMKLYDISYSGSGSCEGSNTQFKATLNGFFHSGYSFPYESEHVSVHLTNLDNGKELVIQGETDYTNKDCTRFSREPNYIDVEPYFEGMTNGKLYIRFFKDEDNGIVAGNYSVKLVYYTSPDSVYESNTFEFVVKD